MATLYGINKFRFRSDNNYDLNQNQPETLKINNSVKTEKTKSNAKLKNPLDKKESLFNNRMYVDESISGSGVLNQNGSQYSLLSIDLNKFKILSNNNINNNHNNNNVDFETFNPSKEKMASMNNVNKTTNKNNANYILQNFNPYKIENYLGKNYKKTKITPKTSKKKLNNFVNNISPSTSNLQMILYNKKIEEEKFRVEKNKPENLFKTSSQKEDRRMLVEYIKVLSNLENTSIKQIMNEKNINPYVLQLKQQEKNDEVLKTPNSKNNSVIIKDSLLSKLSSDDNGGIQLLNNFINEMEDESIEKIEYIQFLTIPRIMKMMYQTGQKISFIFSASPTPISCTYGIETYIFKWIDCKNFNMIGSFDFINVDSCCINCDNSCVFDIFLNSNSLSNNKIENKLLNSSSLGGITSYFCIEADDEEIANRYVEAINFVSKLIKYKIYLRKKERMKIK